MVEMLGVLTVMGLLGVVGVMGLRSALDSAKANKLIQALSRRATVLAADKSFGTNFTDNTSFGQDSDYTITCTDIENTNLFSCTVQSVAQEVCEKVKKSDWKTPTTMLPTTCGTTNDMVFTFSKDLDGSGTLCSEETPCPNPNATCTNGVCVEPLPQSCDTNAENPCGDECQTCNPSTLLCENACTRKQYLESTGTQYIDLNYIPKMNTGVKGRVVFTDTTPPDQYLIGSRDNTGNTRFWFGCSGSSSDITKRFIRGNVGALQVSTIPVIANKVSDFSFNYNGDRKTYWDEQVYTQSNAVTFTPTRSWYLFCPNDRGDAQPALRAHTKLYYLQIYEGTELVRDYIPVLDFNNTPAMYDKVEKKLYHNKGTGDFLTD